jgi:serine/threonine protein kinase
MILLQKPSIIYRIVTLVNIYGITQDLSTQDMMIVMPYYRSGDLIHYITKDFYNISWLTKLYILKNLISGLENIHSVKIVHRDFHSGNIFINNIFGSTKVGDLGLSKSATAESTNDDNNG